AAVVPEEEMSTKRAGVAALARAAGLPSSRPPEGPAALPQREEVRSAPAAVVPAVTSEGQLVPALVVGLGQMGLAALKQLAEEVRDRFGSLDALPQLRLLYPDTGADAFSGGAGLGDSLALTRREVMVARLNRAAHYLHPRPGRPRIDKWFDTNMLYRIRRNPVTGGLRALGRLAFVGNYRNIAARL